MAALSLLGSGCDDKATEEATAASASAAVTASASTATTAPTTRTADIGEVQLTVPLAWRRDTLDEEQQKQLIARFRLGKGDDAAVLTVHSQRQAGTNESATIIAWMDEFKRTPRLAAGDALPAPGAFETRRAAIHAVKDAPLRTSRVEVTGTWIGAPMNGQPKVMPPERKGMKMVGYALLYAPGQNYYLKLLGPSVQVVANEAAFAKAIASASVRQK